MNDLEGDQVFWEGDMADDSPQQFVRPVLLLSEEVSDRQDVSEFLLHAFTQRSQMQRNRSKGRLDVR